MLKIFNSRQLIKILLASASLATSLFVFQNAYAAAAGKVIFATGVPQALSSSGVSRALKRGDEVFSGDNLQTPKHSRLQISFADGAYISVQPESEYKIEDYQYSGKTDGSEKSYYRLLKGGIRAVTGLIGKKNREAYKVHTAVATIGIRGTGHNTRICAGDCPGKHDGLYHNTWEGVTTVDNDADSAVVPAGKGVYVEDINSDIKSTDQPSRVTALETVKEVQEEQEDEEERTALVSSGEQRSSEDGLQDVVVENEEVIAITAVAVVEPTISQIIAGQVMQVVAPDPADPDSVDAPLISNLSIFKNADGNPVGIVGTDNESTLIQRQLATIDLAAMLGGDDAATVAEIEALLEFASASDVDFFLANPASVAEFSSVIGLQLADSGIGFGRWSNGRVLSIFADGEVAIDELIDNQSIHFVFGPEPLTVLASTGTATYHFIGGTQSTSVSGATIGAGVTKGFIGIDFGTAEAFVGLDISHSGTNYLVTGKLGVFATGNAFGDINARAFTGAAGSICNPSCSTFIDGTFFAPESNTFPKFAGLEYDIQDTDVVTGVAAFELNDPATPLSQVISGQVLQFVQKETDPLSTDAVDAGNFFNLSLFLNGSGAPIGLLGTEEEDDGITVETFRLFAVTDINAALDSDNPAVVAEALALLNTADPANIAKALENPAQILEFSASGDVGFGRWGNGNLLFVDKNLTDPGIDEDSGIISFSGDQSLHFIYGPDPGIIPTSGSATYNFLDGTQSTSISGATIGNGAIAGFINVNFGLSNASINMDVDHAGALYSVSGSLMIDGIALFDTGVVASTGAAGSVCNPSCTTFIDGGFAGPANGLGEPTHIGIEYDINDTDVIIGVAAFGNP